LGRRGKGRGGKGFPSWIRSPSSKGLSTGGKERREEAPIRIRNGMAKAAVRGRKQG